MSRHGHDGLGPPDSLRLHVQRMPSNTSVVHVDGPLLAETTASMRRTLSDELLRVPELLALNLTGVTIIDNTGIDALTSAAMQAGESDIVFCLLGADHGPVGAALSQADLTELFEMSNSLDDIGKPPTPPDPDGQRYFGGSPTSP